jgi:hypothetical protein
MAVLSVHCSSLIFLALPLLLPLLTSLCHSTPPLPPPRRRLLPSSGIAAYGSRFVVSQMSKRFGTRAVYLFDIDNQEAEVQLLETFYEPEANPDGKSTFFGASVALTENYLFSECPRAPSAPPPVL